MDINFVLPEHLFDSLDASDDGLAEDWYKKVYLADVVDARIDALVHALKSCTVVLSLHMEASEKFYKLAREAQNEADKALSL